MATGFRDFFVNKTPAMVCVDFQLLAKKRIQISKRDTLKSVNDL